MRVTARSVVGMQSPKDHPSIRDLVRLALDEDSVRNDVTSRHLVPSARTGTAAVVARAEGVVAGLVLLETGSPLTAAFPEVDVELLLDDGSSVACGDVVARLRGPARDLLALERTLLNFLQRASGIATATARYVEATRGTRARIQETRKTCPGWRILDKYAVRCGGGLNHRQHLGDMVLIKENHIQLAGLSRDRIGVAEAISRVQDAAPDVPVESEVEDLEQLDAALTKSPDVIMLDEFDDSMVREAVQRRDGAGPPPPLIEVSGSIRLDRVRTLACLGVDRISVGALTHSVEALDMALDMEVSS